MKYSHAENIFELTSENSIVVITYDKVKCIINLIVIDIDTVEICDLHVNRESDRNKGYGTLLLNYACNYIKKQGYKYVVGDIVKTDDHQRLKKFYTERGFEVILHEHNNIIYKIRKKLV